MWKLQEQKLNSDSVLVHIKCLDPECSNWHSVKDASVTMYKNAKALGLDEKE